MNRTWLGRALALSLCASAFGCDEAGNEERGGSTSGPLYVGATRIFSDEGSRGYMFTVDSLGSEGKVDLKQAVEMDDAWVFGDADPYFYTATIFEPTITRWELSKDGKFVKGPTLSFANEGVGGTYIAAFTPMFSKEKAYFADAGSMQIVVWNPTTMELLKTIPIDAELIPGLDATMDLTVRDSDLVATIFWGDESLTKYGSYTRTVVIDPETDEVTENTQETRCQTLSPAGETSDGTIYYSAWDYHTAVRQVFGDAFGVASCGLRMKGGEQTLDPDFEVDLSTLTGGRPTGSMVMRDDTHALLHVFHDDLLGATPETWMDLRFDPAYTWYSWEIGSDTAEELPDQEPSGEGADFRTIDGKLTSFRPNAEYDETTLYTLGDDGRFSAGVAVPGWIATMIRAR